MSMINKMIIEERRLDAVVLPHDTKLPRGTVGINLRDKLTIVAGGEGWKN